MSIDRGNWLGQGLAAAGFLGADYAFRRFAGSDWKNTYWSKTRTRTKTLTMTKRQRLTSHPVEKSYGSEHHYKEHRKPWPLTIYRLLKNEPKLFRVYNGAGKLSIGNSVQAHALIDNYFHRSSLIDMYTDVIGFEPATTPAANATVDFFIEKLHAEIMVTNATIGQSVRLFIGFFRPRRDMLAGNDVDTQWGTGTSDAGSANADLYIGSTPFQVSRVTENWKCTHISDLILTAGATHVEKVDIQRKHKLNDEELNEATPVEYRKKWTTQVMLWGYGLPAPNTDASATTTEGSLIRFVTSKQYSYSFINNNKNAIFKAASGISATQGTNVLDPETGQSVAAGTV